MVLLNGAEVFRDDEANSEAWTERLFQFLTIDYPKFYRMDLMSRFGFLAAELILRDWPRNGDDDSVAVVLSNRSASLDTDLKYVHASANAPSPALFVYTLPNIVTGEIAIRHGLKGENAFFVSADFDADTLHGYVDQVLIQPFTRTCLAGWVDVLDGLHDVLLYLVEKRSDAAALPHTPEQLDLIYRK